MPYRLAALVLAAVAIHACTGALAGGTLSLHQETPLKVLTDGVSVDVQVDPARGGAIPYVRILNGGYTETSGNIVDQTSPTGRELQAAFWTGQNPPCSDGDLCNRHCLGALNPTQAGDACGLVSGGTVLAQSPTSITVRSQPRDFSASTARPLQLDATVAIVAPGVLRLDYAVTNLSATVFGDDAWQNLPVLFTVPAFDVVTLDGRGAVDNASLPFENVVADVWRGEGPIDWVARSNADGWTVLLYVPGLHPWSIGKPGAQSPGAGWMQPLIWMELQPGESAALTAWIVVGRTLDQAITRLGTVPAP